MGCAHGHRKQEGTWFLGAFAQVPWEGENPFQTTSSESVWLRWERASSPEYRSASLSRRAPTPLSQVISCPSTEPLLQAPQVELCQEASPPDSWGLDSYLTWGRHSISSPDFLFSSPVPTHSFLYEAEISLNLCLYLKKHPPKPPCHTCLEHLSLKFPLSFPGLQASLEIGLPFRFPLGGDGEQRGWAQVGQLSRVQEPEVWQSEKTRWS